MACLLQFVDAHRLGRYAARLGTRRDPGFRRSAPGIADLRSFFAFGLAFVVGSEDITSEVVGDGEWGGIALGCSRKRCQVVVEGVGQRLGVGLCATVDDHHAIIVALPEQVETVEHLTVLVSGLVQIRTGAMHRVVRGSVLPLIGPSGAYGIDNRQELQSDSRRLAE